MSASTGLQDLLLISEKYMNAEEALNFVELLLREQQQKSLNDAQQVIFREAWKNKTYLEIAVENYLNEGYVRNQGADLWKLLQDLFEVEVTKPKLKGVVESLWRSHHSKPPQPLELPPPPPPNWQKTQLLSSFTTHQQAIGSVAISPDGQTLASGSWDGTIKLWNLLTGEHLRTIKGHAKDVTKVIFSPDGQTLISGSYDRTIRLWHLETEEILSTLLQQFPGVESPILLGHSAWIECLALSPEGQVLASSGYDNTIILWDIINRVQLCTLRSDTAIISVTFSPDGSILACGCMDGSIKYWHLEDVKKPPHTLHSHSGWVICVAISPDNKTLLSGTKNKKIEIWDLEAGEFIGSLKDHQGAIFSLAISPDGKTLASSSQDTTIKLWNLDNHELLQTLKGHTELVTSIIFSYDGQTMVSGSEDCTIKVWRASPKLIYPSKSEVQNTYDI